MVASALSMGSGAYLAAKSEWEIYEAAFAREKGVRRAQRARGKGDSFTHLSGARIPRRRRKPLRRAPRGRSHATGESVSKRKTQHERRGLAQASGCRHIRCSVNGCRGFHPSDSVLFSVGTSRSPGCRSRLAPCTLRCRRGQVSHHDPFLVEQWPGNDGRRRCRRACDVLHWDWARPHRWRFVAQPMNQLSLDWRGGIYNRCGCYRPRRSVCHHRTQHSADAGSSEEHSRGFTGSVAVRCCSSPCG